MILVDTNVVVRLLTADDPGQHVRSRALVERGDIVVPLTVLLETEWVLRSRHRMTPAEVVGAMRAFVALPSVAVEDPDRLARALGFVDRGLDFADALHLAATPPGEGFLTFDRDLIRRAQALGLDARQP